MRQETHDKIMQAIEEEIGRDGPATGRCSKCHSNSMAYRSHNGGLGGLEKFCWNCEKESLVRQIEALKRVIEPRCKKISNLRKALREANVAILRLKAQVRGERIEEQEFRDIRHAYYLGRTVGNIKPGELIPKKPMPNMGTHPQEWNDELNRRVIEDINKTKEDK